MSDADPGVLEELRRAGVNRGDLVALAVAPGIGLGMATPDGSLSVAFAVDDPSGVVHLIERALRPRWVMWSNETAAILANAGVRVATSWDIAAVRRLLFGGWRADPACVWAQLHDLTLDTIPKIAPPDLFNQFDDDTRDPADPDGPLRRDGHLSPEWVNGGWRESPERLGRWAQLASVVVTRQQIALAELRDSPAAAATARSESAAELLCAELSIDGLPMDRTVAEELVADIIGPRPRSDAEAAEQRAARDIEVLRHAPLGAGADLRSPGQVKSLLRGIGIEVPDTRAWRLETMRDAHPLIGALLAWRKAERFATTYGYAWIDEHLAGDSRLRGTWTGSDGAAGRMTASAGLHNMPADMRVAVIADPGHVFVRADLGQIEPRVLAAVSGDRALARATVEDDMYAPVAQQLGVDRATAKVAVLGAMYGQTTGHGAHALRRLESAYPVAMSYLADADLAAQGSRALRTYGGRLIPMGTTNANEMSERDARGQAAARGRYGRNALVQGAAAEFFKLWAVTVRARGATVNARIVLCLHDELLVHAPADHGDAVGQLLADCLQEAAHRWAPDNSVRFVADISVIRRWSDAKD
ncbi:MAG: putative polymerase [Actinomycetia bacterium]|nr:putative polymerase [Actinomycetes bacterium]